MTVFEQDGYDVRLEWAREGVTALGSGCAVLVVVDVLVFTTSVDIVLGRGGRVLPLAWRDERAQEAARAAGATLTPSGLTGIDEGAAAITADPAAKGWSLRPSSLVGLPAGEFLGISSLNGATLVAAAAKTGATVFAGCLRNASAVAVAAVAAANGEPIGVLPAGERWRTSEDRPLRPSIEDWLGAGAICAALTGTRSPEADLAATSFLAVRDRIGQVLTDSVSGRELIAAGVPDDVVLASDVDASTAVPLLRDGVFA
jgi:2-phosphosulfolactate phosphatase